MKRFLLLLVAVGALFAVFFIYRIPAVNERLGWRIAELQADIKYALNPPQQVIFMPKSPEQEVTPTVTVDDSVLTPSPLLSLTLENPTGTVPPTATITPTSTPMPVKVSLTGFKHAFQSWNNCGPANLAMGLSFWGWEGTQQDTAAYLKPNERDKNVMPYEMEAFVKDSTDLNPIVRVGGSLDLLKTLISAGFPVIVEKGFEGPGFDGWMGHYEVVNGYDDAEKMFYAQDSYKGPDFPVSYDDMLEQWRAFNYTYLVIYPPEREPQVFDILDEHANAFYNYRTASQLASEETTTLTGRDLFFAYFNLGTNLVHLNDYGAAAVAYDAAFANYPNIPENERPWRMLWYQTGPYFAYYYTGRYDDVIELADTTLSASAEPVLEESYYWRAKAKLALGDEEGAIADFKKSIEVHPGFTPSVDELQRLGVDT